MTFDSSKHPRNRDAGTPGHPTQFTATVNPEAASPLTAYGATAVRDLLAPDSDDVVSFTPEEIGEDQYGPVDYIDVSRDRWRDEDDRVPNLLEIAAVHRLNLLDYRGALSEDEYASWLSKNRNLVEAFFGERYDGADLDYDDADEDDPAGEFRDVQVRVTTDTVDPDITLVSVLEHAERSTKIRQLAAEADHGTFGSENLGRVLHEYVDRHVASAPGLYYGEVAVVTEAEIDTQVALRSGTREVSDAVARKIAWGFRSADYPALASLASRGIADRELMRAELLHAYNHPATTAKQRARIDMLFTWELNGGDNS